MTEGPDELIAIHSTEFVRWFGGKGAKLYAILAWLDAQDALKKTDTGKRPDGKGYEWAVTSRRCPGWKGKCIVLRLPIPK